MYTTAFVYCIICIPYYMYTVLYIYCIICVTGVICRTIYWVQILRIFIIWSIGSTIDKDKIHRLALKVDSSRERERVAVCNMTICHLDGS